MLDMIVNCNLMEWQDASDKYPLGTKFKVLRDDEEGRTVILQLPKDFRMEGHCHTKNEQHYVLEGQYELEGRTCGEGTYQLIHAEMSHGPFTSETGAIVLVIWN